jgi:hypothetical protein
MEKTKEIEAK